MLKKSIIAVSLILALLFGIFPAFPQSNVAKAEDYTFKADSPSAWAKEVVGKYISQGKVPESLQENFKRPITVSEYAELNYNFTYDNWGEELFNKIKAVDPSISDTAPAYVKKAFITGFITDTKELGKTMTREEAASRLTRVNTDLSNTSFYVKMADYNSISPDRLDAVAVAMDRGYIPVTGNNFSPKSSFTVEQAMVGMDQFRADYLLGIIPLGELKDASSIVVRKNSVSLSFGSTRDSEDYIYGYVSPRLDDLDITGKHQRFDVGYMIIELNGTDFDVRYTLKNNVVNVRNFDDYGRQPTYGMENYKSEPRELKASEKITLVMQPDAVHKKLYAKLDAILKTIVKPGMTQSQKIKVLHDYVAKNISYSGNPDYFTAETALRALETKKGVCAHYASLYYYLAKRASLPVRILEGDSIAGRHMWNLVFINNQWLHLDATWDDSKNKLVYDYYLKPMEHMMKTHVWSGFSYPDPANYPKIDGMKIKTTMEFRVFVLQQLAKGGIPSTIKFKLLNKSIDKDYKFLRFYVVFGSYTMKYDAKSDTYTLIYKD